MAFKCNLPDETVIQERKARSTGTVVVVQYAPSHDEGSPWETVCMEHGGVCCHTSRRLALDWAPHPDEWCEDCMYGPGTLDGTAPQPGPGDGEDS